MLASLRVSLPPPAVNSPPLTSQAKGKCLANYQSMLVIMAKTRPKAKGIAPMKTTRGHTQPFISLPEYFHLEITNKPYIR